MAVLKKILVLLPVVVLGMLYAHENYALWHRHAGGQKTILLAISFLLLYGWILIEVWVRKQNSLLDLAVQSSYYIYIFMVLTLTGYFIMFRELSMHGWWHQMMVRISRRDHVNLSLFKIFHIYRISNTQILGNFIMLLPFGIYFPLLYKRGRYFWATALTGLTFSFSIELLQLVTRVRSADVDDILLNTLGACTGFMLYSIFRSFLQTQTESGLPASSLL